LGEGLIPRNGHSSAHLKLQDEILTLQGGAELQRQGVLSRAVREYGFQQWQEKQRRNGSAIQAGIENPANAKPLASLSLFQGQVVLGDFSLCGKGNQRFLGLNEPLPIEGGEIEEPLFG
jgi:hypothetical protein